MSDMTNNELAAAYYAACFTAITRNWGRHGVSIYQDGKQFHAASSGVNGYGDEIYPNVDISDFGSEGIDGMTKDEFVNMCIESFGIPDRINT